MADIDSSLTEQWILRAKVALAVVIIRCRPTDLSGAEYARQLAQALRSKHKSLQEICKKMTLELLQQQEKIPSGTASTQPIPGLMLGGPKMSLRISLQSLQQGSADQNCCLAIMATPWSTLILCPRILEKVLAVCGSLPDPKPVVTICIMLADWIIHNMVHDTQEASMSNWSSSLRYLAMSSMTCTHLVYLIIQQLDRLCSRLRDTPLYSTLNTHTFNSIYVLLSALEYCPVSECKQSDLREWMTKLDCCVRRLSQNLPLLAFYIWHVVALFNTTDVDHQNICSPSLFHI